AAGSGGSIATSKIGTLRLGSTSSGSMTWVPSEAKKVATCCCALRAMAFTLVFVEITALAMKSCGYRFRPPGPGKGVGFTGNRRLVRTKVAGSAKTPARSMAATPGVGNDPVAVGELDDHRFRRHAGQRTSPDVRGVGHRAGGLRGPLGVVQHLLDLHGAGDGVADRRREWPGGSLPPERG